MDAGRTLLISIPKNIFAIWGITSPIQPITPLTETHTAVINVVDRIAIIRNFSGLTPRE